MSWYSSMKPFRTNLKLVINKYLCILHYYLPGFKSSSNSVMLIETSRNISSYNFNSFGKNVCICFFTQIPFEI